MAYYKGLMLKLSKLCIYLATLKEIGYNINSTSKEGIEGIIAIL
jgi:hypothetical protein